MGLAASRFWPEQPPLVIYAASARRHIANHHHGFYTIEVAGLSTVESLRRTGSVTHLNDCELPLLFPLIKTSHIN